MSHFRMTLIIDEFDAHRLQQLLKQEYLRVLEEGRKKKKHGDTFSTYAIREALADIDNMLAQIEIETTSRSDPGHGVNHKTVDAMMRRVSEWRDVRPNMLGNRNTDPNHPISPEQL